jgi:5-hydroxyisourate hydrolase-like protein (transthyretin family)
MKKVFSLLLLSMMVQAGWSQSGEGYDPENPGDPDVYYTLMLEASPLTGGTVSFDRQKLNAGKSIYVSASPRLGYEFKRWMAGDSLVSTDKSFSFTMPEKDVVLTAYFEWNSEYDPQNPGDPDVYYTLMLEAAPLTGGTVSFDRQKLNAGKSIYVSASPRLGYEFKRWMVGDSLVSTDKSFSFTMPEKDVVLTAYFEWNPGEYNPQNPGDPIPDGYSHHVSVYASPSVGGYFNSSSFTLLEGKTTNIYAYPREGYRFESWMCNGEVVSTDNPLNVKMGTADIAYTATFVYNPVSPGEPSPNVFNAATGEVVIDNFTPGSLNSAIYTAVGSSDNYSLVQSITVIGKMLSSDFGFSRKYRNCTMIDLSRTTGYTEVPSYSFEGAEALTKLILPASVERIGNNAFNGCKNLSELYCYATIPPEVSENTFSGVDSALVVKVPASAVTLYQNADGWNNYTILPVDETFSMVINLPSDASDGRYKNMYIELENAVSGQTYKYLITDRTSYTFANLIRNTSYNIRVKNAAGAILGEKEKVMLGEDDLIITFEHLRQPQTLTVKVLSPEGLDLTSQTIITWLNEDGSLLANGSEVSGVLEGTNVTYRIALPQALAMQYKMPTDVAYTVKSSDNNITCQLQAFEEVALSGRILDVTTEKPIANATITISQLLNGKYTKSATTRADNEGKFAIKVFNEQSSMTVSATNYLSQTSEYTDFSNGQQLGDVLLKAITGAVVTVSFTYMESVEDGHATEEQSWYSDEANVTYSLYNQTQNKAIEDFNTQNGSIVLLEEVSEGDVLNITAKSKTGMFRDVTATATIDARNRASVIIPIVALGGLKAYYTESENNGVVGILYDSDGVLLRKSSFNGDTLTVSNLADGNYTLVSMGSSNFFNSVLNLSELTSAGLEEGRDFAKNAVTISSGHITKLNIGSVPTFDESQFYYTGENTSFSANKSQVTIGNYITLRAKVNFKDEYATSVRNLKLIVDLPESCSFVDNSVLTGNGMAGYEYAGNRVTVNINKQNDVVRFCVIPTTGGTCKPNAFVQFNYGGETIMQPIGSAYFNAQNLAISVPKQTADSVVVVNGTAQSDCIVKVYDGNVLVGQTRSLANGRWSARVNLYKPYSHSFHNIYAEVGAANGQTLLTDTKLVEFGKTMTQLKTITMLYNGKTIVFDQIEGTTSTNTYSYVPGKSDFTFIAEFTKNDTALIKNLEFKVLASDGTVRRIPGSFNSSKKVWVGSATYDNSSRIPANVSAEYILIGGISDNSEARLDQAEALVNIAKGLDEYNETHASYELVEDKEDRFLTNYQLDGLEEPMTLGLEIVDYETVLSMMDEVQFDFYKSDEGMICDYTEYGEKTITVYSIDTKEEIAIRIVLSVTDKETSGNKRIAPLVFGVLWIGDKILLAAELAKYLRIQGELDNITNLFQIYQRRLNNWDNTIDLAIYEKCPSPNNDYRLKQYQRIMATEEQYRIKELKNDYINSYEKYLRQYGEIIARSAARDCVMGGIGRLVGKGIHWISNKLMTSKFSNKIQSWFNNNTSGRNNKIRTRDFLEQSSGIVADGALNRVSEIPNVVNPLWFDFEKYPDRINKWSQEEYNYINNQYISLLNSIRRAYMHCPQKPEDPEDEAPDYPTPPLKPSVDPSGYVYEGVSSNRLQGVTATAYYMETTEDMYGVLHDEPKVWDAEEYAQENPLFTDENGIYQWDVPQGMWQVKFEKEGYETTYSEWLPVPPPQLEVNIGMVQNRQPEVKLAHAYKDGIEVEFDKYMQPALLNTENILVSQHGEYVEGEVKLLNEETAYDDENVKYASKVRFVPTIPFTATEVTLTVANRVKSYAGLQMQDSYQQTFDIEQELKEIKADSAISVAYEGVQALTVQVLPSEASAGKTLHVKTSSAMIASVASESYVLDKEGKAEITVTGELPGSASLTYTIDGYDLTSTTVVNVDIVSYETVATPTASIASGSVVDKGTSVELFCATEGATIYYTLDGSCPCDETGNRKVYDGTPIVINETTTIKAMAVAPDMVESDVAEFTYIVDVTGIAEVTVNGQIQVWPLPVHDKLNVTVGGKTINSVIVSSMNGIVVTSSTKPATKVTLDVSKIPTGIYVIIVATDSGSFSRKILKM